MPIWAAADGQFEAQNFSDQTEDMGLETLNSLLNLGNLSFFLSLYVAKLSAFVVLYFTVVRPCGWCKTTVSKQLRSAGYNELILLGIESSFDIFVAGYL